MIGNSSTCNDATLTPLVKGCRDDFDFTLSFEQLVFTAIPASVFLIIYPLRIAWLLRIAKKIAGRSLQLIKLAAIIVYVSLQTSLLVLWCTTADFKTATSISAATLSLTVSLCLGSLSYLEHHRSLRPSTLLNLYLLLTLFLDAFQVRTLWLISGRHAKSITALSTASFCLKGLILVLEACEKRKFIIADRKDDSPETTSGILNLGIFYWLNTLLRRGFRKVLLLDDLYPLDIGLRTRNVFPTFWKTWKTRNASKSEDAILYVLIKAFAWPLLNPVLPRLLLITLNFVQTIMLQRLLSYLTEDKNERNSKVGYGLIGGYGALYLGTAVINGLYWREHYRFLTILRGSLISAVYETTLDADTLEVNDKAAVSLMSTDIDRITQGLKNLHESWAAIVETGVGIWLLERQLGVACVVPIVIAAASALGASGVGKLAVSRQGVWMEALQKRIGTTASILASAKGMKMLGWEKLQKDSIASLRSKELRSAEGFRMIILFGICIGYIPILLSPVATFGIFLIIAQTTGKSIDIPRIFTSLALLSLLSQPLSRLFENWPILMGAIACLRRIEKYLNLQHHLDRRQKLTPNDSLEKSPHFSEGDDVELVSRKDHAEPDSNSPVFVLEHLSLGWTEDQPVLKDISITIPRSKLTLVVGPVASGKSTLCKALLGECHSNGNITLASFSDVAYCSQTPFLTNASIRENITTFSYFDSEWYSKVLEATALKGDLERLPDGDQTLVGSNGSALSGGQKQRIAIARAVYSKKSIAIFDDVLSGLDNTTQQTVFDRVFGSNGLLRLRKTTVILTTHAVDFLRYADQVITIDANGSVQCDTYDLMHASHVLDSESEQSRAAEQDTPTDQTQAPLKPKLVEGAKRQYGDTSIYRFYGQAMGYLNACIMLGMGVAFAFLTTFPRVWLEWWADGNGDSHRRNALYMSIYAVFGVAALSTLFLWTRHCLFNIVLASGSSLHMVALDAVFGAPLSYFSQTDSGAILNHFSQDMQLIDGQLPGSLIAFVSCVLLAVGQAILIATASPYLWISFPLLLGIYYLIQNAYLRTSRQLRLLDLETKNSLYTHFLETISGLITIRAFGWTSHHAELNYNFIDTSQRPIYLLFQVQQWLELVLGIVSAVLAVIVVALSVELDSSAGFSGVALVSLMDFAEMVRTIIVTWTAMETSIGAVSRIRSLKETNPSEDRLNETETPPLDWPSQGKVEFQNVSASYESSSTSLALNDISLCINAGEKFGICGSTGSGKSSLLLSMLHLLDLQSGQILIDGLSVSDMPRHIVRSRLNCVPQESLFIAASVRYNLDPSESSSQTSIQDALTKVQLWDVIESKGGLDIEMNADMLSEGQKQLFCLARAMLRTGKLVMLDEPTSSIDQATDSQIQQVIRTHFQGRTIIVVAHRLETIADFDRVAVMSNGKIVESGPPRDLLAMDSAFRSMWRESRSSS